MEHGTFWCTLDGIVSGGKDDRRSYGKPDGDLMHSMAVQISMGTSMVGGRWLMVGGRWSEVDSRSSWSHWVYELSQGGQRYGWTM